MTDYISRESVIKRILCAGKIGKQTCIDIIKHETAADVRPVVRGEWKASMWFITCSVCGYTSADTDDEGDRIATNYCPNCGADMRKKEDK